MTVLIRKPRLYLVAVLLFFAAVASAQEVTEEPVPEDFYSWSARMLFPDAVHFDLVLDHPAAEVVSLNLTIEIPDRNSIDIVVNPNTAAITEPYVALRYVWQVSSDNPPQLFDEITYRWQIITTRDRVVSVDDTFIYTDTRATWIEDEDPEGRIHITFPFGEFDPDILRRSVDEMYDLITENVASPPVFNLLIFTNNVPVGCARNEAGEPTFFLPTQTEIEEQPCNLELAQQVYETSGYSVMTLIDEESFQFYIATSLLDRIYGAIWEDVDVPQWFWEGLARFYMPGAKGLPFSTAQQASRNQQLLSLEEMATRPIEEETLAIWQAQSYGMVLYMVDIFGIDGLQSLLQSLDQAESFSAAYEQAVGQRLDVIILGWENWLFKGAADLAYSYHPYLPETPTPTHPPTITSTPTLTVTPSPTDDSTSTPTRTITPRPPTRTITPRPASSFTIERPTPTPSEIAQPVSTPALFNPTVLAAILGVGIILLLIVIGIVRRLQHRN